MGQTWTPAFCLATVSVLQAIIVACEAKTGPFARRGFTRKMPPVESPETNQRAASVFRVSCRPTLPDEINN